MKYQFLSGTVLVYTMVLVVLGVFMASVVLNIAVQLSVEYDARDIEISLADAINTKGELSMKYARDTNASGSGFVDIISCPDNITMSGSTLRTTGIGTDLRYISGSIVCRGESVHNGNNLDLYFNSTYTDLQSAEYEGISVAINSSNLTGNFGDTDATFLDLGSTNYLGPDGYDDNFDSDDYTLGSNGLLLYPDEYVDNDDASRLLLYGYLLEQSGLYNVFWANSKTNDYISSQSNNINPVYVTPNAAGNSYLILDTDNSFRANLYRINTDSYSQNNEIIVEEIIVGEEQSAGIGYLQSDLSLASGTGSAYGFDFSAHDYALFLENTGSGSLLYRIRGEQASSGKEIYINPLDDTDTLLLKHLGSHILLDDTGRLLGDMFETYGLKSSPTPEININIPLGFNLWLDAADTNTISTLGSDVVSWSDKSLNGNNATQSVVGDRPSSGGSTLNSRNTISFSQDYLQLDSQQNIQSAFFVIQNQNGSNRDARVTPIFGENTTSSYSYTHIRTNAGDVTYDISIDGRNTSDNGTVYYNGGNGVSGGDIDLGLTESEVEAPSIWHIVFDSSIPIDYIGGLSNGNIFRGNIDIAEIITYDRVLDISETNQIGNYLGTKWGISWTDL